VDEQIMDRMDDGDRESHTFATESIARTDGEELTHPMMDGRYLSWVSNFGPIIVPQDQFFVMGDHRNNSFDSRRMGTIGRDRILGKAIAIAFSLDRDNWHLPRRDRFFEGID